MESGLSLLSSFFFITPPFIWFPFFFLLGNRSCYFSFLMCHFISLSDLLCSAKSCEMNISLYSRLFFFFFWGTNSLFPFKSRKWVVLVGIHLLYLAHRYFVLLWRTILKVLGENHDTASTARWDSRHGSIDRSHLLIVVVFSIRNDLKGENHDTVSIAQWDSQHGETHDIGPSIGLTFYQ